MDDLTSSVRIDCTHPGCDQCAAQIVDGKLLFRARHNGEKHQVVLELREVIAMLKHSMTQSALQGQENVLGSAP